MKWKLKDIVTVKINGIDKKHLYLGLKNHNGSKVYIPSLDKTYSIEDVTLGLVEIPTAEDVFRAFPDKVQVIPDVPFGWGGRDETTYYLKRDCEFTSEEIIALEDSYRRSKNIPHISKEDFESIEKLGGISSVKWKLKDIVTVKIKNIHKEHLYLGVKNNDGTKVYVPSLDKMFDSDDVTVGWRVVPTAEDVFRVFPDKVQVIPDIPYGWGGKGENTYYMKKGSEFTCQEIEALEESYRRNKNIRELRQEELKFIKGSSNNKR